MRLYLVEVENHHPEVLTRYKYIFMANGIADANRLSKHNFDGIALETEVIKVIELNMLSGYAAYLPDYIPENLPANLFKY